MLRRRCLSRLRAAFWAFFFRAVASLVLPPEAVGDFGGVFFPLPTALKMGGERFLRRFFSRFLTALPAASASVVRPASTAAVC